MDDILKFQRIQGPLDDVFKKEKICCSCIDTNYLVLGSETGVIYIVNFSGQIIKSVKSHTKAVNDISVDNNNGLTIVSCSDAGSVEMVLVEDNKQVSINFNEPLKKICIEKGSSSGRKERSFIVGSDSGRLTYHRTAWYTHKDIILFAGAGSEVISIAWKGNLVAWADATQVRIMDISTQTAICRLNPPLGVGIDDPYPCSLFWQSDFDLIIGWADSFRQVAVSPEDTSSNDHLRTAKTLVDWKADCIICSVYPFDANHVIFLGYTPPPEDDPSSAIVPSLENDYDTSGSSSNAAENSNYPEILIAKRMNGELVSADTLPLRGSEFNMRGPFNFSLLSSYQCSGKFQDAFKWDLNGYRSVRGGDRGFAPTTFIVSSNDFIIARLRDVNDRTAYALQQQNLKLAVELAKSDKNALKKYKFSDLLSIYLTDLLERKEYTLAAAECERLIDVDLLLWESWIYTFKKYNKLSYIANMIPIDNPRLNAYIYEEVVVSLIDENTEVFAEIVKKWSKVKSPVLFNHNNLITILQAKRERVCESNLLEAQAQLYILRKDYENALGCYMDIKVVSSGDTGGLSSNSVSSNNLAGTTTQQQIENSGAVSSAAQKAIEASGQVVTNIQAQAVHNEYKHVFELFDAQPGLFKAIEYKVINLVRLSKPLSAKLLISNIDKLPIKSVASQLSNDKKLLFWYLHALFRDAFDIYGSPEYAELHIRQMELYAEFAPKVVPKIDDQNLAENVEPSAVKPTRVKVPDSDFLVFLKSGLVQAKQALTECERHDPPLYTEMIYLLSQLNRQAEALQIHLTKIGDVSMAIEFIENQIESESVTDKNNSFLSGSGKRHGRRFTQSITSHDSLGSNNNAENPLWDDLIAHALDNKEYLVRLLDYLGVCKLNPERLLRKIHDNPFIPYLKLRLCRVISQLDFQVFLNERCNVLLETDALSLLRQQNQGQRKAMKVDAQMRCTACSRPIFMDPGSALNAVNSNSLGGVIDKSSVQIWGVQQAQGGGGMGGGHHRHSLCNGVIVFSNKIAFHKVCYERIPSAAGGGGK